MADCLISLVEEIGKRILNQLVIPFLEPHFNYWWCFDTNIQRLDEEVEHLDQIIGARVVVLFEEKRKEGRRILQDHNIPAWNIISRYSMGKRAKKTAEEIAKLLNDGNFNTTTTMEFESRKDIEKGILDRLRKSTVGMIVICGMGGVGKTSMAERIRGRVMEEDLFEENVMVTVGQTIDDSKIQKIQSEIAEALKLDFHEKHETLIPTRAAELRKRLMDRKRKLIIVDDVWDSFGSKHFKLLGIPIESKMCKVLLTSRYAHACKEINGKEVLEMKILKAGEAWHLFKDKAGNCVENEQVNRVAREVAEECKGLPLALVTVGLALQNITDICIWRNSLSQLRKANPEDFVEVSRDVYNPLKLSYDFLDNDRERSLFLLCCLFPEDFNISVEQLSWYSMGLGLFDNVDSIEEARNRTHTLVEKLESRSLLIDVAEDRKVKMHDVIRDVAIYIGSIEKRGFLKSLTTIKNLSDVNCNWMSVDISNEQMEVPVLSRFPKLRLLMFSSNQFSNKFYDISFEGMEALNVLSFERVSIRSLPPTLGSLENLQTLRLFRCQVENISVIGELTSLKILSCCDSGNITELPEEIGRLKGLRLLELNGCWKLRRIPFGIISSLSCLEELKIRWSFSEWETAGGERRNASLKELEHLLSLTSLEIEISDCTSSAQEIRLSQKLVRYRIRIDHMDYNYFEERDYEKLMNLNLAGAVGNWIQLLARNAEILRLKGDGSDNINLAEMENLRTLRFTECSTVKKLVDAAGTKLLQLESLCIENCESMKQVFWNEVRDNTNGCIEFPKLESLSVENLPNLTAFCQRLDNINFPNLTFINIIKLPKLNSLFPLKLPKDVLRLEDLLIHDCESMEQVFWYEGTDHNSHGCIEFSKLKTLNLYKLPNLTVFCQGIENIIIKFPNLINLIIGGLPKLNSLSPLDSERVVGHDHNTCFHFLCNPKVEMDNLKKLRLLGSEYTNNIRNIWCSQIPNNNIFNNLEELHIYWMNHIRSLMSTSIAKNLVSLQQLYIGDCEEMVEVIETDDDNDKQVVDIKGLFSNLKSLSIDGMPKLIMFWQWKHALELPLLESMYINDCTAMETFTLESINTPNIMKIEVNGKKIHDRKDLNDIIRHIRT